MGIEIDLANAFDVGGHKMGAPLKPVDRSGLPSPTRAIATLSDGVQFECNIQYVGITNGRRRFRVTAEIDWATCNVVSIGLDRLPSDVWLSLRMPADLPDAQCVAIGAGIHWYELDSGEKMIPMNYIRHDDED
jgi:hypothetical protein